MASVQYHNCLIFLICDPSVATHLISVLSRYTLAKMHNDFKSHVFYQFSVLSHEFKSLLFCSEPF